LIFNTIDIKLPPPLTLLGCFLVILVFVVLLCITSERKFPDFIGKYEKRIRFIVSLFIVLSILFAVWQFEEEQRLKQREGVDALIRDIDALIKELEFNINVTDAILNKNYSRGDRTFYANLVAINIEERIKDDRIRNADIKHGLFVIYADIDQTNRVINMINSPEFVVSNILNITASKRKPVERLEKDLGLDKVNMMIMIDRLKSYRFCLEQRRDFNLC